MLADDGGSCITPSAFSQNSLLTPGLLLTPSHQARGVSFAMNAGSKKARGKGSSLFSSRMSSARRSLPSHSSASLRRSAGSFRPKYLGSRRLAAACTALRAWPRLRLMASQCGCSSSLLSRSSHTSTASARVALSLCSLFRATRIGSS